MWGMKNRKHSLKWRYKLTFFKGWVCWQSLWSFVFFCFVVHLIRAWFKYVVALMALYYVQFDCLKIYQIYRAVYHGEWNDKKERRMEMRTRYFLWIVGAWPSGIELTASSKGLWFRPPFRCRYVIHAGAKKCRCYSRWGWGANFEPSCNIHHY